MENINLTEEEKKELEKRGFYVKPWKNFTISGIFFSVPIGIIVGVIMFAIIYLMFQRFFGIWICYIFSLIPTILIYVMILNHFAFNLKLFYGTKNDSIFLTSLDSNILSEERRSDFLEYDSIMLYILGIGLYIFLFVTTKILIIQNELLSVDFLLKLVAFKVVGLTFIGIIFMLHFFRNNPLYAFGNIGMKIQELSPEIEKESKLIQSEFQKEQNFSVLRSGFEKLSSTFSRIVKLVIRLESIESRANKGNLFDSGKYIGSLRADIVTPLSELKQFLEEQRDDLLDSQKELSRVKVGVDDSLGANRALSSKRSDILLAELDESIGKIGGMIEKMG